MQGLYIYIYIYVYINIYIYIYMHLYLLFLKSNYTRSRLKALIAYSLYTSRPGLASFLAPASAALRRHRQGLLAASLTVTFGSH